MRASYIKRPSDTLRVSFDFTEFAASAAPEAVTYDLRVDPGIVVAADVSEFGAVTLDVTGGTAGRQYELAVEGSAAGRSLVKSAVIRLREVRGWAGLPVYAPINGGGQALFFEGQRVFFNGQPLFFGQPVGLPVFFDGQPLFFNGQPVFFS